MPTTSVLAAIVVDLVAVTLMAGPLYFRRHRRRDLMLSYLALNVGVLGVALALSGAQVGVGLGLGLFGVLSIVRLRSDQITQAEIAYYFTSLALGLLAALGAGSMWMPATFSALLLGLLYLADHPRMLRSQHRRIITLDRAYVAEADLRDALTTLLGAHLTRVEVTETDLVRDTTTVDVRFRVPERTANRVAEPTAGLVRPAPAPATIAARAPIPAPAPTMAPPRHPSFGGEVWPPVAGENAAATIAPVPAGWRQ